MKNITILAILTVFYGVLSGCAVFTTLPSNPSHLTTANDLLTKHYKIDGYVDNTLSTGSWGIHGN